MSRIYNLVLINPVDFKTKSFFRSYANFRALLCGFFFLDKRGLSSFLVNKTLTEFIMANNLFVSYRPSVPDRDIALLIRAIASLGGYTQVQEFFWYVRSNKNAETALEVMRDNIDPSDTLIVIDSSNNEFEMNRNLRDVVESRIRHVWE